MLNNKEIIFVPLLSLSQKTTRFFFYKKTIFLAESQFS